MTTDAKGRSRMLKVVALSLGLAAAALPGTARAQFFGWDDGGGWGLPGPQVRRAITEQGFRVLGPLRRNGNVFVADVIDQRGRRERLIVGVADAQILQRFYVDDGRGSAPVARAAPSGDALDREAMVPPADIPGVGRPSVRRPVEPGAGDRRYGDLGGDESDPAVVPTPPRGQPPIRTVRPRVPRVVERTPEAPPARREPGPVEATPLAPVAPRPRAVEAPKGPDAAKAPAAVASHPAPAATPAALPAAPPRRMTDPLAIPGGPNTAASGAPVRSVSGGVTGAPAGPAAPPPAAKAGDVPAAPLD